MAIRVVGADAHQRERGPDGVQYLRILVRRSVMGHFEHLGGQSDRVRAQQVMLLLGLRVAEQQDRDAAADGSQDQAVVVRIGPGPGVRLPRPEELEGERSAHIAPTGLRRDHRNPGRGQVEQVHSFGRLAKRRDEGGADRSGAYDAGDPADVVKVKMRDRQDRYRLDPEPPQAGIDPVRVWSGIHEDRLVGLGRQDDRVALADVAHDGDGMLGWPARGGQPYRHRARGHTDCGDENHPANRRTARAQYQCGADRDEQSAAGHTARPREGGIGDPGADGGDRHQPPRRPGGHPGQQRGRRRPQWTDEDCGEPEHGRRGNRWRGEKVRRHGDQAHPTGQQHDQRTAGHLRRRRDRERLGRPAGHAAAGEPVAPPGCDKHQRGGGEHREREPGIDGEVRVGQETDDDSNGERRHGRPPPADRQGQQADHAHRGSPNDTRGRPNENHKTDQGRPAAASGQPRPSAAPPGQPDNHGQHDRHVGATDRDQVGQAGGAEARRQVGRDPAGVTDHQAGQQATGLGRQPGTRRLQSGAQPTGDQLSPRWTAKGRRRVARGEHGRGQVATAGRRQRGLDGESLGRQQAAPGPVGTEHNHVGGEVDPGAAHHQLAESGRHEVGRRARS